jgi:hypothetical protein
LRSIAARRGQELLAGLGFKVERLDNLTLLLRGGERRAALAVLLDPSEIPEAGTVRFNNLSPVSYALAKADAEGLPWVMVLHGDRLRLYPTAVATGVGRRGRTETYVEVQTSLLADEHLAYVWLLFSAEALDVKGSVPEMLDASKRFAGDLAVQLRERIYKEVVPRLARAIADARRLINPSAHELDLTYRIALTVLFRLLFIAYAEDRDLLPYRTNDAYRRRSLKQKAQELAEAKIKGLPLAAGNAHWEEVERLFRAVNIGNSEWGVPPYDGGLFTTDKAVAPAGAALAGITLADAVFEPVLEHLLLIETRRGRSGRSISVRSGCASSAPSMRVCWNRNYPSRTSTSRWMGKAITSHIAAGRPSRYRKARSTSTTVPARVNRAAAISQRASRSSIYLTARSNPPSTII